MRYTVKRSSIKGMNIKTILLPILIFLTSSLKAEELPLSTIVDLSIFSDRVLEAIFLKKEGSTYTFLTKDIHSVGQFTDTLKLENIKSFCSDAPTNSRSNTKGAGFTNCEKLILYFSDFEGESILVGARLLKDEKIYTPFQIENPGGYSFAPFLTNLDWGVFKKRVIKVHQRITAIKNIRDLQDSEKRNEGLFNWIEQFKNTFYKTCEFDSDCGWGMFEWQVFEWITIRENSKDTWRASQLFRSVKSEETNGMTLLREKKGSSFRSYKDIDFLMNIASDSKRTLGERTQALVFLSPAVDIVYDNNDPLVDSTNFAFQVTKQKNIRQSAFELMEHPDLRYHALQVVKNLTNPKSYGLRHRTDASHLPQVIQHYEELKDIDFATAYYKSDLAYFIARNSSEKQWRDLNGSDANILMDVKQMHVDSTRKTISISVLYSYGKRVVNEIPTVVITSLVDGKEFSFREGFELRTPWTYGSRYIKMNYKSMGLEKGDYTCHLTGRAGEENELFWKSKFSNFSITN